MNSCDISACHHILQEGTLHLTIHDLTYLETERSEAIVIYKPRWRSIKMSQMWTVVAQQSKNFVVTYRAQDQWAQICCQPTS